MRRIDYGLCSGNFCPQRLMRYAGVADPTGLTIWILHARARPSRCLWISQGMLMMLQPAFLQVWNLE